MVLVSSHFVKVEDQRNLYGFEGQSASISNSKLQNQIVSHLPVGPGQNVSSVMLINNLLYH